MAKTKGAYHFDKPLADRAERFFASILRHTSGQWAGKPFALEKWQRQIVRDIVGWRRADGTRKYRMVYLEVPRKNGKTAMGAGLALLFLTLMGEQRGEIYSCAADTDQAAICFDTAKSMTLANSKLASGITAFRRSLYFAKTSSNYRILSADAHTKHGYGPSVVLFDELHAQPNRDLWDVMLSGMGARKEPLTIVMTTAGYDTNSICYEQHEYARKVLDGIIQDETFYPVIYAADPEDDWTSPKVWKKANPNYGVTVSADFLAQECKRAQETPAYENTFRRLYLNQWTQQESRWMPMEKWLACHCEDWPALDRRSCYAGLDLSTRYDLTALVLVFPPLKEDDPYFVEPHFWIPRSQMMERIRRDRVPYDAWERSGFVHVTEGDIVDYAFVKATVESLGKKYRIEEIAFDRWGAAGLSTTLQDSGFALVEFGQGFSSMSAPMKDMMGLVISGKIAHDNNPVLNWNMDAVVAKTDPAGNIKPVKPDRAKSANRIDGVVALIMGLDRALRAPKPRAARGIMML